MSGSIIDLSAAAPSRRQIITRLGGGFGAVALAALLGKTAVASTADAGYSVSPRPPHHSPRAKAVIQLFMHGGPSHIDLLDPKPVLAQHDGQPPPSHITDKSGITKTLLQSPFVFARHGQSGVEFSELLPHTSRHADSISVIRSMVTEHRNHEQALWMMHTGLTVPGRPTIGAWAIYGLGSENENLPAYVVLPAPAPPVDGIRNWSSGWLPPVFQGTPFRAEGMPIQNLRPRTATPPAIERGRQRMLAELNASHRARHPQERQIEARIASFELAARMQISATQALDIASEPPHVRELYGLDNPVTASYGSRCLLARRLVERGVRFVQIFMAGQPWDTHTNNAEGTRRCCQETDLPVAGLLTDLRDRGLLDSTLVFWGGEFGRTPAVQEIGGMVQGGRDHHPYGFSIWLAGGGIKGGQVYGATDDFGYHAVQDRCTVADLHATMLYLLGLDHKKLTFFREGRDDRLTDIREASILRRLFM